MRGGVALRPRPLWTHAGRILRSTRIAFTAVVITTPPPAIGRLIATDLGIGREVAEGALEEVGHHRRR